MEFLVGSILAIIAMRVMSRKINSVDKIHLPVMIKHSQAHTHSLLKPIMPFLVPELRKLKETQASKHNKKTNVRIIFTENEAYWITDNKLFTATVIDGLVDENSTSVVDTMTMDKVQLDRMVFIVEKLTEGLANDSSNTGD